MEPTTAFDLNLSVEKWCNQFFKKSGIRPEDIDEIQSHLLDEIDELLANGKSLESAYNLATSKLGEPSYLVAEYKKVHSWYAFGQRVITIGQNLMPSSRMVAFSLMFVIINAGSIYGQIQANKQWKMQAAARKAKQLSHQTATIPLIKQH